MLHPSLDPDVLDVCGVLPVRSRIRRNLLNELAGDDSIYGVCRVRDDALRAR